MSKRQKYGTHSKIIVENSFLLIHLDNTLRRSHPAQPGEDL